MQGQQDAIVKRGRGRPRSADYDAEIRNAAWQLIAQLGCEGLTFEALAQAVGCSRSTLYRRFSTKGQLVATLLNETARSFAPQFEVDAPPREKLLAHARTLAAIYTGDRGAGLLHIMASSRRDPEIAAAFEQHSALVEPHYFAPLRQLVPEAGEKALGLASHSLMGSMIHHLASRRQILSEREIEHLVDASIALLRLAAQDG